MIEVISIDLTGACSLFLASVLSSLDPVSGEVLAWKGGFDERRNLQFFGEYFSSFSLSILCCGKDKIKNTSSIFLNIEYSQDMLRIILNVQPEKKSFPLLKRWETLFSDDPCWNICTKDRNKVNATTKGKANTASVALAPLDVRPAGTSATGCDRILTVTRGRELWNKTQIPEASKRWEKGGTCWHLWQKEKLPSLPLLNKECTIT